MAAHLGVPLDGWELHLEKHVPAEAGLGGGSADAAAAARLVAGAAGRSIDAAELAEVIRPLGADVAFFAWGGTMRGEGVGDVLTPLPMCQAASVLLVRPPFGVSTAQAYGWYDETSNAERRTLSTERRTAEASIDDDRGLPESRMASFGNDLEGPVAARHPEIRLIVERLREAGARLRPCREAGRRASACFAPEANLPDTESDWPDGTRVWHTRLLSRAEYAEPTAVRSQRLPACPGRR